MDITVGNIYDGKVTKITKFGAFVQLAPGKSGMVHISEIANTFVDDITKFLSEGQEVKVKVLSIDDEGRINLSVKKAAVIEKAAPPKELTAQDIFESKLKAFMQSSESRMSDIKHQNDRRSGAKRKK